MRYITIDEEDVLEVWNFRARTKGTSEDQDVNSNWRESENIQATFLPKRPILDHELGHLLLGFCHRFDKNYDSKVQVQEELIKYLQKIHYEKSGENSYESRSTAKYYWDVFDDQEQIGGIYFGTKDGSIDVSRQDPNSSKEFTPEVLNINALSSDWYSAALRGASPRFGHLGLDSGLSRVKLERIENITPSKTAIELYDFYERAATVYKLNKKLKKNGSVIISYLIDKRESTPKGKKGKDSSLSYIERNLNSEDEIFKLCFDRKKYHIMTNDK